MHSGATNSGMVSPYPVFEDNANHNNNDDDDRPNDFLDVLGGTVDVPICLRADARYNTSTDFLSTDVSHASITRNYQMVSLPPHLLRVYDTAPPGE